MSESASQPTATITERVIAEFSDYSGMLAAMRLAAQERQLVISSPEVATIAGIPDHYLAKLLSPKAPRHLGPYSMAGVLAVLGVKLVMVENQAAIERVNRLAIQKFGAPLSKRNESCVHAGTVHIALSGKHMRAIRRKGGANSRKNLGKRLRRALARKAANARWAKAAARAAKAA
jgi:hypothetical protein